MTDTKRILFGGYAPVHFLCFRPVYELLRADPRIEVWLTGGFRRRDESAKEATYELDGFYEPFGVDPDRVAPFEQLAGEHFDAVVCAHSSTVFFPASYGAAVQIFHGVSFKNLAVREKVLKYDYACVTGRYHAEQFETVGLLEAGPTRFFLTGMAKLDPLARGEIDRDALLRGLGLDPARPTVLYAPTGGKHNSLDEMGEEIVRSIGAVEQWNLLVKPHDHPKKSIDWFTRLAEFETGGVRLVRDLDVVPYLAAADVLLTDASSVAMEYTLLDRPIVFIDVPALLENVKARGGALDLATHGRHVGVVVPSPDELVARIGEALEGQDTRGRRRRAAAEHLFHSPGSAAANVAGVVRFAAGLDTGVPDGVERIVASGATS